MSYSDISQVFKDIKSLADKAKDAELTAKVIELQLITMDLQQTNFDLMAENRALKEKNDYQSRLNIGDSGELILDGDTSKRYCASCWGNNRRLNLLAESTRYDIPVYACAACGQAFAIEP
jgi:hypothetical protein